MTDIRPGHMFSVKQNVQINKCFRRALYFERRHWPDTYITMELGTSNATKIRYTLMNRRLHPRVFLCTPNITAGGDCHHNAADCDSPSPTPLLDTKQNRKCGRNQLVGETTHNAANGGIYHPVSLYICNQINISLVSGAMLSYVVCRKQLLPFSLAPYAHSPVKLRRKHMSGVDTPKEYGETSIMI